jgi:hypothetical protein
MDTVSVSGTKRSYSTTEESRALRRAKTSKRKADKLDISFIRWMALHNERNG